MMYMHHLVGDFKQLTNKIHLTIFTGKSQKSKQQTTLDIAQWIVVFDVLNGHG